MIVAWIDFTSIFRSDEECLIEQNGTGLGAVSAALVGFRQIIRDFDAPHRI